MYAICNKNLRSYARLATHSAAGCFDTLYASRGEGVTVRPARRPAERLALPPAGAPELLLACRRPPAGAAGTVSYDTAASLLRHHPKAFQAFAAIDPVMSAEAWLEVEIAVTLYGFAGVLVDVARLEAALGARRALVQVRRAAALSARTGVLLRFVADAPGGPAAPRRLSVRRRAPAAPRSAAPRRRR